MTYASLVDIFLTKNSTLSSDFFVAKIRCKNVCNFFLCEFYAQKFAKNLQKFFLIRLNAVTFFRFSQLLVEVKNEKNEISIISNNSSNMAAIGLKICTKKSQDKCLRILDTRAHLGWGPFLHENPARPFQFQKEIMQRDYKECTSYHYNRIW